MVLGLFEWRSCIRTVAFLIGVWGSRSVCVADVSVPFPSDYPDVVDAMDLIYTWNPQPATQDGGWYQQNWNFDRPNCPTCEPMQGSYVDFTRNRMKIDGSFGSVDSPYVINPAGRSSTTVGVFELDNGFMDLQHNLDVRGSFLYNTWYDDPSNPPDTFPFLRHYYISRFDSSVWNSVPSPEKNSSSIDIGANSTAGVYVTEFGQLSPFTDSISLGLNPSGDGVLSITDFASASAGGGFIIGQEGHGSVEVQGDGLMRASGAGTYLGMLGGGQGELVVGGDDPVGSRFPVAILEGLYVGGTESTKGGSGLVAIEANGLLVANEPSVVWQGSQVQLNDGEAYFNEGLTIHGTFRPSGTLGVFDDFRTEAEDGLNVSSGGVVEVSSPLTMDGTINVQGGDVRLLSPVQLSGYLFVDDGLLEVNSGSTFEIYSDPDPILVRGGTFRVGPMSNTEADAGISVTKDGLVEVNESGNLSLIGKFEIDLDEDSNRGGVQVNDGTVSISASPSVAGQIMVTRGEFGLIRKASDLGSEIHRAELRAPGAPVVVGEYGAIKMDRGRIDATGSSVRLMPATGGTTPSISSPQFVGSGVILADTFINEGILEPREMVGGRVAYNDGMAQSHLRDQREALLTVVGDYHHEVDATLVVNVNEDMRSNWSSRRNATPVAEQNVPLYVTGDAHIMGGTLEVKVDAALSAPEIGARYNVLEANRIYGRFHKIKGSQIDVPGATFANTDDTDDPRFWGLLYTEEADDREQIELAVMRQPQLMNGTRGASNAVFVAHGIGDADRESRFHSPTGAQRWVQRMAQRMGETATGSWDTWALVWPEFSSFSDVDPVHTSSLPNFSARYAGANGQSIGEAVVMWMEEQELLGYAHVHALGHSAGSWTADAFIDKIAERRPGVTTHLTLFDAYSPNENGDGIRLVGKPEASLGDTSLFNVHYLDSRFLPTTNWSLREFLNVEVSEMDDDPAPIFPLTDRVESNHAWPRYYYLNTVEALSGNLSFPPDRWLIGDIGDGRTFGYRISKEVEGAHFVNATDPGLLNRGERVKIYPDGRVKLKVGEVNPQAINLNNPDNIVSDTGQVTYNPDGSVDLATGSPVQLYLPVNLNEPADILSFDYEFVSNADGLFSAYLNGEQFFGVEERDNGDGLTNTGSLILPDQLDAGLHTLLFMLQPEDTEETQSSVQISNVEFRLTDEILLCPIGDLDGDCLVDANDIDVLRANAGSDNLFYDLNGDGIVNFGATPSGGGVLTDSDELVRVILDSEYGDANLDGNINTIDFSILNGAFSETGGWSKGNFNGDEVVNTIDFSILNGNFGFSNSSAAATVPEPNTWLGMLVGLGVVIKMRRRVGQCRMRSL